MVDVVRCLTGSVGEQNGYVQVVVAASQVVVGSGERERNALDLFSCRASDSRLRVNVERGITSRKSVKAGRSNRHIDSFAESKCLKFRHVPVVFGLYSLGSTNWRKEGA